MTKYLLPSTQIQVPVEYTKASYRFFVRQAAEFFDRKPDDKRRHHQQDKRERDADRGLNSESG